MQRTTASRRFQRVVLGDGAGQRWVRPLLLVVLLANGGIFAGVVVDVATLGLAP